MLRSSFARNTFLLLAAIFFVLRFVHLTADYPRNIRWDDGIATDEGWYASGAVNLHTWGTPLLPGDMNIPVIMPVWSLIAEAAFRIGGFNVVSLRVTEILFFCLCAGLCCVLLRRYGARDSIPLFLAMFAMNPWAFAFSRAAFLEFPMLSFCLLAVVLIRRENTTSKAGHLLLLVLAGISFALAVLLKTTAIALSPLLLYAIAERSGFRLRHALRNACVLFFTSGALYSAYWLIAVRPQLEDVQFYLSVVKNTLRLTPYGFIADTSRPFRYGLGSDHLLFALSILTILATVFPSRLRALWREPLFALAAVWLISFLGFMVKHNNDPSRYFAVTIPACLFVGIALLRNSEWASSSVRRAFVYLVVLNMAVNGLQVLAGTVHPRFTFHNATTQIAELVQKEDANPVLIGDDMHEIALHNKLRPVNLLFHSDSVMEQMRRYQPGWWVQFSPIEDGRCYRDVLGKAYTAEKRGEWEIFYKGQRLILWRLAPIPGATLPATLTAEQESACKPPVYN